MTEKDFLYRFRRGLGSALIELKRNPDREKYRDIVLRCSLKDISYDIQCEGTKGFFLYVAICFLGANDDFEDILIHAFMQRLPCNLFKQLADILDMYIADGSEKSKCAINAKYHSLFERLSKQRAPSRKFGEHDQFIYLLLYKVNAGKWPAFKACVADVGRVIMSRGDDANRYTWFLTRCEDIFGKEKIAQYVITASEKSAEVKAFRAVIDSWKSFEEQLSQPMPTVTLESYVAQARELKKDLETRKRTRIYSMRFSRQASPEDLLRLAGIIANEHSDEARANLLQVFNYIDFPMPIDALIPYALSDCAQLQDAAVDALKRFKDDRVHDLATRLIAEGKLDAGLPLLVENWRKHDEHLIWKYVLSTKKISHSMQFALRDLSSKQHTGLCSDVLEHVYQNGKCAFCRFYVVKAMHKRRVLKINILHECLYDSYSDTREMAQKIKKRMRRRN